MTIVPPAGVPDPQVTESIGGTTTTVNNDAHVRVWVVQIPAEGTYDITTDGKVNGYINPQLAFGHDARRTAGWLWAFAGLFVLGLLELHRVDLSGAVRSRRRAARAVPAADPRRRHVPGQRPVASYTPTDGIRFEQLKNLAALRDSGALTEDEYEAEKSRILEG